MVIKLILLVYMDVIILSNNLLQVCFWYKGHDFNISISLCSTFFRCTKTLSQAHLILFARLLLQI